MTPEGSVVYGQRGKLGLVVPANNSVIEPEFASVLPSGFAVYASRVMAKGDLTTDAIRRMEADVETAVDQITATGVDVIAYCDMVTTFIMQSGWNEATVERFSARSGSHVISAWTALRDALGDIGAKRIALGTPYPLAIHGLAAPFFMRAGIEVASDATLDIVAMREVPTVGPARLMGLVRSLDVRGCDAVVLLATDLPTFGSIDEIERVTGLPVLTSNQTILWSALGAIGGRDAVKLGRLFDR